MFNSEAKEEAIERFEEAVEKYNTLLEKTNKSAMELFESRKNSAHLIGDIESYINTLANSPKEFEREIRDIEINKRNFDSIFQLKVEGESVAKVSGSVAGAGVVAGIGVATFAPTAAMAVATTFGTASTGAAIASLSGAAATKAALAWLGGGAIAAGGTGIAGGTALLTLAGPIGWGIGAVTLLTGGFMASKKNKEIAREANRKAIEVETENAKFSAIDTEIKVIARETEKFNESLERELKAMRNYFPKDYREFSQNEKYLIGSLVNNTLAFSKLLNRKVG